MNLKRFVGKYFVYLNTNFTRSAYTLTINSYGGYGYSDDGNAVWYCRGAQFWNNGYTVRGTYNMLRVVYWPTIWFNDQLESTFSIYNEHGVPWTWIDKYWWRTDVQYKY